jgi:hypothetical protein
MSVSLIEECEAAGLDPKEVRRIANGLSRYGKQAKELGLTIFGGSGSGSLRFRDDPEKGALIVARLDGMYDGGDGGEEDHHDGLSRGER